MVILGFRIFDANARRFSFDRMDIRDVITSAVLKENLDPFALRRLALSVLTELFLETSLEPIF